jgi:hypothetical protein
MGKEKGEEHEYKGRGEIEKHGSYTEKLIPIDLPRQKSLLRLCAVTGKTNYTLILVSRTCIVYETFLVQFINFLS